MGQPHDVLGLIIKAYNTSAQPIARRAATLHYIPRRNTRNEESSCQLFPGKADIERRSCFKNSRLIYLWRYTLRYYLIF
jgi:hypothetical protein